MVCGSLKEHITIRFIVLTGEASVTAASIALNSALQFMHNARRRGKALLGALVAVCRMTRLATPNPVQSD